MLVSAVRDVGKRGEEDKLACLLRSFSQRDGGWKERGDWERHRGKEMETERKRRRKFPVKFEAARVLFALSRGTTETKKGEKNIPGNLNSGTNFPRLPGSRASALKHYTPAIYITHRVPPHRIYHHFILGESVGTLDGRQGQLGNEWPAPATCWEHRMLEISIFSFIFL